MMSTCGGGSVGLSFLNISTNLPMAYNLSSPIYSNGAVGKVFEMAYIIYSAALVAAS